MKSPPSVRLGRVALQILRYLNTHPNAQDTIEGIAEWWLLEQRIRYMITEVKQALAELVAQGMALERTGSDGRVHYGLNPRKHKTVARLLASEAGLSRDTGSTAQMSSKQEWLIRPSSRKGDKSRRT